MTGVFDDVISIVEKLAGYAPAPVAETVAPSSSQSITLAQVTAGAAALVALVPALQACVTDHFRNLGEDATLVEDLAGAVSKAVPAVASISSSVGDVAGLIVLLCKLGVIQTTAVPATPAVVDGVNPNSGAPLFT